MGGKGLDGGTDHICTLPHILSVDTQKHEMGPEHCTFTRSPFNCCCRNNNNFFPSRAVAHKSAQGFLILAGVRILSLAQPSCQVP